MLAQAEREYGYSDYMLFGSPEADPWAPGRLTDCLAIMQARNPLVTPEQRDQILFCYWQLRSRFFHGPDHGGFVSQRELPEPLKELLAANGTLTEEEAGAVLAIAGLFHDISYKHVDADASYRNAWPTSLQDMLEGMVEYSVEVGMDQKPILRTHLTAAGRDDEITKMVAGIFDMPQDGITHKAGGNEFDSALAAAKFLQARGVPAKFIVAVTAAIAATIPFRESVGTDAEGNPTDGYMGELAERVQAAQLPVDEEGRVVSPNDTIESPDQLLYQPDWQTVNAMMLLSTHLANRDTSPFFRPGNPLGVAEGARLLKMEEIPALRMLQIIISGLVRAARLMQSAPGLYLVIVDSDNHAVQAKNVPSVYCMRDEQGQRLGTDAFYPPLPIHAQAAEYCHQNADGAAKFFMMHELGIVFAACIATLMRKSDAPVPGFVDSELCKEDYMQLSEDERADLQGLFLTIYEALGGKGVAAAGALTPPEAPLSRFILGAAGEERAMALSGVIQDLRRDAETGERNPNQLDPFSDPKRAVVYLRRLVHAMGINKFNKLMDMLVRVANFYQDDPQRGSRDRVAALEEARQKVHALWRGEKIDIHW